MYGREMIKVICIVALSPIDEQVISAVIDYGDDGGIKIWGDPTFFDAARYMAGLVDNESIEEDEVIAGSCEIQSGVNDDNSFIPFYKRALNGLGRVVRAKRRK